MMSGVPDSLKTSSELLRQHYLQRLPSCGTWHEFWLKRCLELALGGLGCVAPNPLVGAVLVRPRKLSLKDYVLSKAHVGTKAEFEDWQQHFEILGQGYHVAWGQLHAETAALEDAFQCGFDSQDFSQAVLYCNLEPCNFYDASKRQPPCCEKIIQHRVGAVVFANNDPNPAVSGAAILRNAGLIVRHGDFATASAIINQIFFHRYMSPDKTLPRFVRPWVGLKFAQSLDGCIATKSGHSQWLSGPIARTMVQALRASHGATCSGVAVGRGTLEADDPNLLLRPEFFKHLMKNNLLNSENQQRLKKQQPWRIVWDSNLHSYRLPLQFYHGLHKERSIVVSNCLAKDVGSDVDFHNIAVHLPLHSAAGLCEGLEALARPPYNIQYILLEGGSRLASSFLASNLVDEIYLFISHRIVGRGLPAIGELQPEKEITLLSDTLSLKYSSSMPIREYDDQGWNGPDEVLCHGYLNELLIP